MVHVKCTTVSYGKLYKLYNQSSIPTKNCKGREKKRHHKTMYWSYLDPDSQTTERKLLKQGGELATEQIFGDIKESLIFLHAIMI